MMIEMLGLRLRWLGLVTLKLMQFGARFPCYGRWAGEAGTTR